MNRYGLTQMMGPWEKTLPTQLTSVLAGAPGVYGVPLAAAANPATKASAASSPQV
jgi:hypothetical protein